MIQALLTSTSVRPNFSSTCSAAATSEALSVTSGSDGEAVNSEIVS